MAITTGGSNLLVEKGEKIGLGVAAVVGVGLLALGLMNALDRPQDPVEFSKALENKASQLTSAMNAPKVDIENVSDGLVKPVDARPVSVDLNRNPYYDPTQPPDTRRTTPIIQRVFEGQADMAVLKILANDFQLEKDPATQEVTKIRVGVVGAKDPNAKIDPTQVGNFLKEASKRFRSGQIPKKRKDPPAGAGMLGGPPGSGFGGGPPGSGFGGGPPGAGMMGGPGGPGRPGGAGFAGGGFLGGQGNNPPGGYGMAGATGKGEMEVNYIEGENDEDIEKQMNGRRLAITIRPQKMVVLQASFPYRAQLEKFRVALRYQKIEDLYSHSEDMPTFHGLDVQRRALNPKTDEPIEEWQTIDLAQTSQDLRAVTLSYNEDSNDLKRVELHEDHMLVMPLPHELAGKYPEMKLKSIKDSIDKIKKADPKNTAPKPPKTKYGGEGNPFKRDNNTNAGAGLYNPPGGEGMGGFFPPGGRKGGNESGSKGGEPGSPSAPESKYEPPEFVFVRAYDASILDGYTYEYRLRVKVKNPNFGKKGQVSKESDADLEELPPLDEHWYTIPQKVKIPQTGYFYVIDPLPPGKTIKPLPAPNREKGQAVVQFQRWTDYLQVNSRLNEPVGDWIQSELIATRGQFVYGKAFSQLPFWSPTENAFILRDLPGEIVPKGKEPRKGVELYPVRPATLLAVEVAGGQPSTTVAKVPPNLGEKTNRGGLVDDNSAAEVLFLLPDGTMEVHSSARDRPDPDRKERDENFKKWTDDTEKKNPTTPPPKKGGGDF
jgi:hypothetical protein